MSNFNDSSIKKQAIYSINRDDLTIWCKKNNISSFYSDKIWINLYKNKTKSFESMINLKSDIIEKLEENFYFTKLNKLIIQESDDKTIKFLFKLYDNSLIETVLMNHKFGKSVCVTTQIGCNIGCKFCASGLKPKKRNLSSDEMISQIIYIQNYLNDKFQTKLSNVVVMGIGEPFDNYSNLIKFLSIINDDKGLAIGSKHITVSTSGIVPKIKDFAKEKLRVNLALSLHAPNNELRSTLMKINNTYPLEKLFDAIEFYIKNTNKRVTFEYILIKNFNDQIEQAKELVELLAPFKKHVYVNLIPYNPVPELDFERSEDSDINKFFLYLIQNKIPCIVRKEQGKDIDASCGQLRSKYIKKEL